MKIVCFSLCAYATVNMSALVCSVMKWTLQYNAICHAHHQNIFFQEGAVRKLAFKPLKIIFSDFPGVFKIEQLSL
jgi:hypothetical protein